MLIFNVNFCVVDCCYFYSRPKNYHYAKVLSVDVCMLQQQQSQSDRRSLVQQTDEYKANFPGMNESDNDKVGN
jgi:hypothetical protein